MHYKLEMKFQLLSDLHLELSQNSKFQLLQKASPDCDALILAGDIGYPSSDEYSRFISDAARLFKYVFIIMGNHEMYGYTIDGAATAVTQACAAHKNVIFLNRTSYDVIDEDATSSTFENIRIVGTTLWSKILNHQRSDISCFIMDFRRIKNWTVDTHNAQHHLDVTFLQKEIARATTDGKKLIIITHHAPSTRNTCRLEHVGSPISSAYSSDLEYMICRPVVAWVFGHTHHSIEQKVQCQDSDGELYSTLLISNQRGFITEVTGFRSDCTFEVR